MAFKVCKVDAKYWANDAKHPAKNRLHLSESA